MPLLVPMIATPLLLRVLPTHFLPVLVGDYLAAHFALYGLITAACLALARRTARPAPARLDRRLLAAAAAVVAFGFIGLVWPINAFVTSFLPGPERALLILAMLVGTLPYFLADEWLTRGPGAARGGYAASKLAFLVSLAIAVSLDFERLFFLIIIIPVIVPFFLVYGLFSALDLPQHRPTRSSPESPTRSPSPGRSASPSRCWRARGTAASAAATLTNQYLTILGAI